MAASIVVEGLSHRYPGADRLALREVGLQLPTGECLGLLGPNGAGKSTLMRILCGYLPVGSADGGAARVVVEGFDVRTHSFAVRDRVGYMPEQVPLYPELRVREHLAFRGSIKGVPRRARGPEIERVAGLTGIADRLEQPIGQLSRGYRQRVGIADALLGSPPLVILDEPTVGLDPNQVQDVRAMLRDLVRAGGGNQTLVFSSHILAEVEMLCDRVVILSEGAVAADETVAEALRAARVTGRWLASPDRVLELVADALERWGGDEPEALTTQDVTRGEGAGDDAPGPMTAATVSLADRDRGRVDALLVALGEASQRAGVSVVSLGPGRTRLEERFAEVTGARRAP